MSKRWRQGKQFLFLDCELEFLCPVLSSHSQSLGSLMDSHELIQCACSVPLPWTYKTMSVMAKDRQHLLSCVFCLQIIGGHVPSTYPQQQLPGNRGLVGDMGVCELHSLFLLSPRVGGNRRDPQKGVITKTTGANCSWFFLGKGDSFRLASLISGLDWKSQEKPPPSQILPNTAGKGSGLSEKRSITLFTTSFLSFQKDLMQMQVSA